MTLYQILGVAETVPPEMVTAAALVDGNSTQTDAGRTALAVLSDPAARADYDARSGRGLPFELALAWGVAALAAGSRGHARAHWERATRMAPEDRAAAALLASVSDAPPDAGVDISEDARAAARAEIERLRNNSAFPHRLLRYVEAVARPENGDTGEDAEMVVGAARELLQYDMAEAPRAYSMILPVLKEHYKAVYALDTPFFDATAAILSGHTPRAEYERKKTVRTDTPASDYDLSDLIGPAGPTGPSGPSARRPEPPREAPRGGRSRREMPAIPRLPNPGAAWVGALFGALFGLRGGPFGMIRGAIFGFLIAYVILIIMDRRR